MYDAYYNEALDRLIREGMPLEKARFRAHTIAARRVSVTKALIRGAA